jgi:midasin (ATPase involved in ribosome maturation)
VLPVAVDDVDASATSVPGYVHVCGVHIRCRTHTAAGPPPPPERQPRLVVTPSLRGNMETFAHALCGGRPVLLEGPPGCGKSSMLRYFASLTGACVSCSETSLLLLRLCFGSVVHSGGVWLWRPATMIAKIISVNPLKRKSDGGI